MFTLTLHQSAVSTAVLQWPSIHIMHRKAFKTAVRYVCGYVDTKNCEEKDKKTAICSFLMKVETMLKTNQNLIESCGKINSIISPMHYFYYAGLIMPVILVHEKVTA